jgi:centrosomal protein CEP104
MNSFIKLKYNIVKLSSSEEENLSDSAQKIISFDHNWSSERFCTYPQQIILQFDNPVNLRQINIVSHEKKISEKISFFSFCPQKDIFSYDYRNINYEDIGFINLNQNYANNYQVREFKKIFVNIKCLYLKIELDKNYINDYNPYHQVGLIHIDFYGYKLPGYNNVLNKINNKHNTYNEEINKNEELDNNINNNNNNNNYNILIDEISGDKINQLNNKLNESNKNQNIKECIQYKELISKAKELGNKIYNLQMEKNEAIKIEDYDTALKELELLRCRKDSCVAKICLCYQAWLYALKKERKMTFLFLKKIRKSKDSDFDKFADKMEVLLNGKNDEEM